MSPDTPEPEAPEPGSPRPDGDQLLPPRVLVSVGDLEDPAEWDVILVENQEIDDETALRIADERAGRVHRPRAPIGPTVTLPSLDEHDVIQAFETDRDAEDAGAIGVEAFAPPDDGTPLRPRTVTTDLPPEHDHFAGIPEPGDEPEPDPEPEPEPEPEVDLDAPPTLEEAFTPAPLPWEPAQMAEPELLDDPDDEFYAIGVDPPPAGGATEDGAEDAPEEGTEDDGDAAGPTGDAEDEDGVRDADADADGEADPAEDVAAIDEWDPEAGALDERELIDDPDDLFYSVGRARKRVVAFTPSAPPGGITLPAPTTPLTSDLWGTDTTKDPEPEVFEEEIEIDSSFPLGPDDLTLDREVEPVQLDELDYANVFGPVTGVTRAKALAKHDPRRKPRPSYDGELYVFDEDDPDRPATTTPRPPRRRELVALGLAAGLIVALGVGSQVFARSDGGDPIATVDTSTTVRRARTSDATVPDLTLPTAVGETTSTTAAPADEDDGEGAGSTQTTKKRNVTTTTAKPKSSSTTTTPPPSSTVTSTTPASITTTTVAPPPCFEPPCS